MKKINFVIGCFLIGSYFLSSQPSYSMDLEELRSRYLTNQPGGKVEQRDIRLIARVEIIESSDQLIKNKKFPWIFGEELPAQYDHEKSELVRLALKALRYCPEDIRIILEGSFCHLAFNFDIGGTISGPMEGFSGFPVNDQNNNPGRCVTIIDNTNNNFLTNIFW